MPRRPWLALSLTLGLSLLLAASQARPAAACDCGTGEPTVAAGRARLATVVHGRVRSIGPGSIAHAYTVELFVLRSWKGAAAGTTVRIPVDASSCGYSLVPGDEVLIFAPAADAVQQCAGDRTARVRLGADIAADATALGPPATTAVAPARATVPADVVADAVVLHATGGPRQLAHVRVTRARQGSKRHERLDLWMPSDGCVAPATLAAGDRITLRARRLRDAVLGSGAALVSSCDAGTAVRVTRPARRPAAP